MSDSKPKLADFLDATTVDELDEQLVKLGRAWTRVYMIRQLLADEEGNTTPPPAPPKVEAEPPAPSANAALPASPQDSDDRGFDGTLRGLIHCYITDARSPFHSLRHSTRKNYAGILKRINETCGSARVADLKEPDIQAIHDGWSKGGEKIAMAHSMITMVRTLAVFGATVLGDQRCERFSFVLHRMKFKVPETKNEPLSADQAAAIIKMANHVGMASLGLAQAFQFWTPLRQKDVIGEWVPLSEPDESDTHHNGLKWVRGVRWEQIDDNFDLHHVTSKEGKAVQVSLVKFPLLMEQIALVGRKKSGPVVVSELTTLPWTGSEFRRQWRRIARLCEIPENVKNRNSGPGVNDEGEDDSDEHSPPAAEKYAEPGDASDRVLN